MLLKDLKNQGKELGKKAYHTDMKMIPAWDKELQNILIDIEKSTWRQAIMKEWIHGWTIENINTSI